MRCKIGRSCVIPVQRDVRSDFVARRVFGLGNMHLVLPDAVLIYIDLGPILADWVEAAHSRDGGRSLLYSRRIKCATGYMCVNQRGME
jgi:hypothetical protein